MEDRFKDNSRALVNNHAGSQGWSERRVLDRLRNKSDGGDLGIIQKMLKNGFVQESLMMN